MVESYKGCPSQGNCAWETTSGCPKDCIIFNAIQPVITKSFCPLKIEGNCCLQDERRPCIGVDCLLREEVESIRSGMDEVVNLEDLRAGVLALCRRVGESFIREFGVPESR